MISDCLGTRLRATQSPDCVPAWSNQDQCCSVDPFHEIVLTSESLITPSATGCPLVLYHLR